MCTCLLYTYQGNHGYLLWLNGRMMRRVRLFLVLIFLIFLRSFIVCRLYQNDIRYAPLNLIWDSDGRITFMDSQMQNLMTWFPFLASKFTALRRHPPPPTTRRKRRQLRQSHYSQSSSYSLEIIILCSYHSICKLWSIPVCIIWKECGRGHFTGGNQVALELIKSPHHE